MYDHVGLRVNDVEAARRFYRATLQALGLVEDKSGGKDNGKPELRPDYSPCYFAAFLIDPDGKNVEAVCPD
jgi:catechol 2,3-dioxygenase-like lactoylglutathione lyase family enzyme